MKGVSNKKEKINLSDYVNIIYHFKEIVKKISCEVFFILKEFFL